MTIHLSLWVAIPCEILVYIAGMMFTRSALAIMDDGPTCIPWLDTLLTGAAILLWPVAWILFFVLIILVGLVGLVVPR
jgi:hypothetical protein